MNCPNCQSENKEGAKFCNECGFPLTGRIANVAAASTSDEVLRATGAVEPARIEGLPFIQAQEHSATSSDASEIAGEVARGDMSAPIQDESSCVSAPDDSEASASQNSGSLDASRLPVIGLRGVDVDEEGNQFDFSDADEPEAVADDLEKSDNFDETLDPEFNDAGLTSDLSGLDERLVDASYAPPQSAWDSGGTMEMPRVGDAPPPRQKEFRAPDPNEKKRGRSRLVIGLLAVLIVVASAATGITYQMELWGGKMLPDVAGMTQFDATYQLEGKGFAVRATQIKSDETEGLVLLMDPSAGARADKGTEVVIHVAAARVVPEVVGKTKEEAAKLFENEGLDNIAFVEEKSDQAEGTVLSMDAEVGQKIKGTTAITVAVAVPYTVPDVVGQAYDAATKALEEATYTVNFLYYYTEDVAEGLVVSTDPVAGSKLDSGSSITMNVAKSRKAVLEEAAWAYLAGAGSLQLGGTSYVIDSVDSVSYTDYNQTSFTITGRAATTLDGETVYGSKKPKSGLITWDDNNNVVSIA